MEIIQHMSVVLKYCWNLTTEESGSVNWRSTMLASQKGYLFENVFSFFKRLLVQYGSNTQSSNFITIQANRKGIEEHNHYSRYGEVRYGQVSLGVEKGALMTQRTSTTRRSTSTMTQDIQPEDNEARKLYNRFL